MDHKVWGVIAAGSLASTLAAPVLAADPGFYVSAGIGRAEENLGKSGGVTFMNSTDSIGPLYPDRVEEVDGSDRAWSAGVGYRFNPYLAVEAEYLDLGTVTFSEEYSYTWEDPFFGVINGTYMGRYSSKVTGPALSVLGSMPLGKGFELFLRGGLFFAEREVKPVAGTSDSTTWLGGAGAAWSFASRWTLRAEYQRTGNLDSMDFAPEADMERLSLSVLFRL